MPPFLKYACALAAAYLLAWIAAYGSVSISRGDGWSFRYLAEYFRLAWTFSGGELPTFIWLFSIVAFVPMAGLAVYGVNRGSKTKRTHQAPD